MRSRSLGVLLAMTITTGTAPASAEQPVGVSPGHGVLATPTPELERELQTYRSAGMTWIRLDLDWASIETLPGHYDWTWTDRVISVALEQGFRVLALPAYSPSWATTVPGTTKAPPRRVSDFGRFLTAAAERYGPAGVRHWEIWNEPNSPLFWQPGPDPRAYAQMLQTAHDAITAVDPEARIIGGSLAPLSDTDSSLAPSTFVNAMYELGARDSFDALSVHPYSYPALPSDQTDWNSFQKVPEIRKIMVRNGDSEKSVWLTEFGAPTGTGDRAVSEARQARILSDGVRSAKAWRWTGPLFIFAGRDSGLDPADIEQNFGLLRWDFSAKPALAAVADAKAGRVPIVVQARAVVGSG